MIFVMLHYSLHTWLWKYSSRCNLCDWLLLTYCHLDKWKHPAIIISCSCRGDVLVVCLKDSHYPGTLKHLTNRTPSRSWYVGMMTVQFFSCLSLAKVRGMQKKSCCLFLNSVQVRHWCHPLCVILPATEMIKFPMRFTLWNICALDPVALTVCDIFHKIQSSVSCNALHSVFRIESLSVSMCSLCFDV